MSGLSRDIIVSADEVPFRDAADSIYGINVVRTKEEFKEAPASVREAFRLTKKLGGFRCACCGEDATKPAGMIVLRVLPPVNYPNLDKIPMAICQECAREPKSTDITVRTMKTLTGKDVRSVAFKDMQ